MGHRKSKFEQTFGSRQGKESNQKSTFPIISEEKSNIQQMQMKIFYKHLSSLISNARIKSKQKILPAPEEEHQAIKFPANES